MVCAVLEAEEFFSLNPEGIIPVSIRNAGSIVVQFPVRNTYAMKTLLHLIQQDYPNRLNQKSGFSQVESKGVCILDPVSDRFIEDILQPACL